MFVILLHSSKTMRPDDSHASVGKPRFIKEARELAAYAASLPVVTLGKTMGISLPLAEKTHDVLAAWSPRGKGPAIDTFTGDIYSGFQAASLNDADRAYAQKTLFILSGLYGVLSPLDPISPYRLEIGYRFPDPPYANLYSFWGDKPTRTLPAGRTIINTSSAEYTKAVFPHLPNDARIITPTFLSISPKTGEPVFVTVHAKIARGAFARWMIVNRVEDEAKLKDFTGLGYAYDPDRSTPTEPVFIAREFSGIGLSVRLDKNT